MQESEFKIRRVGVAEKRMEERDQSVEMDEKEGQRSGGREQDEIDDTQ